MQIFNWEKQTLKKINRPIGYEADKELIKKVSRIVFEVKAKGDSALLKFTRQFDGLLMPAKRIAVKESDINRAYEKINFAFVPLLKQVRDNVTAYYEAELRPSFTIKGNDGILLGKEYRPIERVGVYIPGGTAPLVSTVYMTLIPAKVAGVKEIAIATPPNRDTGEIDPHILVVADLLGVKEIYRVGGAQAIAALAFGTKTIRKVDKIVGPGNQYVAEAKRQVYGFVDIDMVAGPSEVAILADQDADPNYVTCDLLAQAEHFGGISYLVTTSKKLAETIKGRVEQGYIILVKNLKEGFDVVNEIAPEHLEIMTENPEDCLKYINHAGAIFLGPYSPAVIGDYVAGPSHVLPTSGTARYYSPLSAASFIKGSQIIRYTKEALAKVREPVRKLTEIEGLILHRISLESRFVDELTNSKAEKEKEKTNA
ncbi:MAG: histidinol dehydrogenase [Omnitrophica bacterium RIFCSPLOWO2_12_FULL_44_17]|uniref:Histidinol dehydrogenase n=1 Tax=Candidatus Danuiimicrobium aquiferis TaxID=1801832 RepID=A0A1G1KYK6_9BACT|nr:MAG: histidinol dehydrogenase [Omnitrophica bacterium RIFCSPHIGHO2_02_FULL_45_28]OGW90229.1 MAG: histidinol dehydrogenase [Omnitrophica bacterium RIFCSPHIGHO2_12_FULL_44_12]OGW97984.1 MAG: histidinol dehydrogenase [Omnitrophica bacterium RIFCSPLOWO2_12_FULL_44_17]OGX03572.1 MAG: histidinol dehydrogenase [Omnitrophica bacterium RIFCSPLOWO2_02_FULL_44_11]